MRIAYILLSPTFGMHQYTADYANRFALAGHAVHLITTSHLPRDRYATAVAIHTPIATTNTGISTELFQWRSIKKVVDVVEQIQPDVIHFTGPHLWNVPLLRQLKKYQIPVIHTIHDLDPHSGTRMGQLLKYWNQRIIQTANHILVHGHQYRQRLLAQGVAAEEVTYAPLLHLFLSHAAAVSFASQHIPATYEPFALFFGRVEKYKGIDDLLAAYTQLQASQESKSRLKLVLAGPGRLSAKWQTQLPAGVTHINQRIDDAEALDLFCRCSLVLLPYTDATQSALVAAAYYFQKPVMVTRSGALPEYVDAGETGFVVPPRQATQIARVLQIAGDYPQQLGTMGRNGRRWYDTQRLHEFAALTGMYRKLINIDQKNVKVVV